ncbi:MAG TPA: hypothetical protein VGM12_02385 [Trebonia sp.]|jgi:hypothetical protein
MNTGEFPGYEFEVPRGPVSDPRHGTEHDSLRQLRYTPQHAHESRSPVLAAGSGVLGVMRRRNWLVGLAAPIMAAIAVGVAVVVVAGGSGGNGTAPSALAAGFPPARQAGPVFTGTAGVSRVVLAAIGASAGTEVAAGGFNGGPALWVSTDGGSEWARTVLDGEASLTRAGSGQLAAVAHGRAGWVAVGTTLGGTGGALVASSADARTWAVGDGSGGLGGGGAVASAVAAGPAGYVIVGHKPAAADGAAVPAAWFAPGLAGWRPAAIAGLGTTAALDAGQEMNAVAATKRGFTAVGASGSRPSAWLSAAGSTWRQVLLPAPGGAARAALDYVAANGASIVAAGTEFTAAGASRPFAEVSADGGTTWTAVQLPVPGIGPGTGTTVTALTAAGGGFTAAGTYVTKAGPEVVVWTLSPGTPVTSGTAWASLTPQGFGLAGAAAENAITALAADGATLTGTGFTASLSASGTPGAQQPTLWQSPIRY